MLFSSCTGIAETFGNGLLHFMTYEYTKIVNLVECRIVIDCILPNEFVGECLCIRDISRSR